jgi:hypothetical protein
MRLHALSQCWRMRARAVRPPRERASFRTCRERRLSRLRPEVVEASQWNWLCAEGGAVPPHGCGDSGRRHARVASGRRHPCRPPPVRSPPIPCCEGERNEVAPNPIHMGLSMLFHRPGLRWPHRQAGVRCQKRSGSSANSRDPRKPPSPKEQHGGRAPPSAWASCATLCWMGARIWG